MIRPTAWGRTLLVAALASACVPSEPDKEPRGGISITFAPSEATAGTPFTTSDGWTMTIEKTALRVGATSFSAQIGEGGGSSIPHVIDPHYICELRVTQLPPGLAVVAVQLTAPDSRYLDDRDAPCGLDDTTFERFRHTADDQNMPPSQNPAYYAGNAPSVYVKAHAEKAGRVVRFDITFAVNSTFPDFGHYGGDGKFIPPQTDPNDAVTVEANKGAPVRFGVHFEAMFAGGIDRLASADANGDGLVTAAELREVSLACESTSPYTPSSSSSSSSSSSGFVSSSSGFVSSSSSGGYDPYGNPYGDDVGPYSCRTMLEDLILQTATIVDRHPLAR